MKFGKLNLTVKFAKLEKIKYMKNDDGMQFFVSRIKIQNESKI